MKSLASTSATRPRVCKAMLPTPSNASVVTGSNRWRNRISQSASSAERPGVQAQQTGNSGQCTANRASNSSPTQKVGREASR
ncbi:hypothetical protein D3C75_1063670 [compost metagenome]